MHVLIDLDGTLTDSKPGIVACIRHALEQLQVEIDDDFDLEPYIGPPLGDLFTDISAEIDVEQAIRIYRERFSTIGLYENSVYDGIESCLEKLQAHAESLYVATSKPTVYAERIVSHFGLSQYFKMVYGPHLDGRLSNKAELLSHLLQQENINASNAVMIGDRKFDIAGARSNSIRSIGVLWGYGNEQELRDAGADDLCHHPDQLYHCVFN
jgi:phosphoglycolate phosphatase